MSTAASPILASTIYQSLYSTSTSDAPRPAKKFCLRTGWKVIDDDVLDGGFAYGGGSIVGLCCERDADATNSLFTSLLTSHLLPNTPHDSFSKPHVFYIDTAGTFSAAHLLSHVREHLLRSRQSAQSALFTHTGGYTYTRQPQHNASSRNNAQEQPSNTDASNIETTALAALDHISLMRVLDLEGLLEAIAEVRETLADWTRTPASSALQRQDSIPEPALDAEPAAIDRGLKRKRPTRETIPSSQTPEASPSPSSSTSPTSSPPPPPPEPQPKPQNNSPILLLIPTLSRLLPSNTSTTPSSTLSTSLLTHFLRALRHLTSTYRIAIVLGLHTRSQPGASATISGGSAVERAEGRSSFADATHLCVAAPAVVEKALAWGVDVEVLVWEVGRWLSGSGREVEVGAAAEARGKQEGAAKKFMVECTRDRCGGRAGRWGVWSPS